MPRLFKLYQEYEEATGGGDANITFGLEDAKDRTFTNWEASIMGPQSTSLNGRLIKLQIYCNENYPVEPPKVNFVHKVYLPSVDRETGVVDQLPGRCKNWNPSTMGIKDVLIALRIEMEENGREAQPPEGEEF